MTTAWMHPLARAARVLSAQLIELERRLPKDPIGTPEWAEYKEVARLLAEVVEANKTAVPAVVVKGQPTATLSPATRAR